MEEINSFKKDSKIGLFFLLAVLCTAIAVGSCSFLEHISKAVPIVLGILAGVFYILFFWFMLRSKN